MVTARITTIRLHKVDDDLLLGPVAVDGVNMKEKSTEQDVKDGVNKACGSSKKMTKRSFSATNRYSHNVDLQDDETKEDPDIGKPDHMQKDKCDLHEKPECFPLQKREGRGRAKGHRHLRRGPYTSRNKDDELLDKRGNENKAGVHKTQEDRNHLEEIGTIHLSSDYSRSDMQSVQRITPSAKSSSSSSRTRLREELNALIDEQRCKRMKRS